MRDGRRTKLGKGESKRRNKAIGRQDWGRLWYMLGWASPSLGQSWIKTEVGDKKLRDNLWVSRADESEVPNQGAC